MQVKNIQARKFRTEMKLKKGTYLLLWWTILLFISPVYGMKVIWPHQISPAVYIDPVI
jgi:hypothetical protein